jgi:hypothetical protein
MVQLRLSVHEYDWLQLETNKVNTFPAVKIPFRHSVESLQRAQGTTFTLFTPSKKADQMNFVPCYDYADRTVMESSESTPM